MKNMLNKMPMLAIVLLSLLMLVALQSSLAEETNRYTEVARKVVDRLNAGDDATVQQMFNANMGKALPPAKASPFFKNLAAQFGNIETIDNFVAKPDGWKEFRLHCQHGELSMRLALDSQDKIGGIYFQPVKNAPREQSAAKPADPYATVARKLIDELNAGDYGAVQKMFNADMNQALPLDQASEFFKSITAQMGNMERFDNPVTRPDGWKDFLVHCQRGKLTMRLALDSENKIAGLFFEPATSPAADKPTTKNQTQLSLPFKGRWNVFWGGDTSELNHHHNVPAQRFAFDILGEDATGATHRGNGAKNEDYVCWGREIYAPADGTVVEAIDGVRDNTPGSMNPYCLVGNCVVIEHRVNEFSVLAHFQRGTVAVKAGDRVKRGQLLGKCGNSGNSSEPHLHYHLQNSAIFQDALGIKCFFDKVPLARDRRPEVKTNYSPIKGDAIEAAQ